MNPNEYQSIMLAASALTVAGVGYLVVRLPRSTLKTKQRGVLVDTSVLMDGRITSVAATGFIGGALVIPRSVVGELQLLADGSDSEKRSRARRGLDIVSELQHTPGVEVEILQDSVRADEGVDNRLLSLAKRYNAAICTLDFNLNKVAVVEGIQVLNINELAQSLRMSHIPGEHIVVELTQKGQDSHQAVGHLADGTMVVVEQGSGRIGQTLEVEVIRSLQTAAGRMMFARIIDKQPQQSRQKSMKQPQPARTASPRVPKQQVSKPQQQQPPQSQQPQVSQQPQPQQRPQQRAPQAPQKQGDTPRRYNTPRPQRRPSQRDREAALMDLVDKQS